MVVGNGLLTLNIVCMQMNLLGPLARVYLQLLSTVEPPITNHLRDHALDLETYKVVQFFPMSKGISQEECKFFW